MGQGHGHHHHHHHHHHHGASGRLALAFALNLAFALIELVGGILTNSVAITSDALHDFGDAMAIGMALYMEKLSKKKSDSQFSYGYRRASVFSAVLTGVVLLVGSVYIISEAIPRLITPSTPHVEGMIGLALLGLAVNGFAAWRVSKGTSLSERMIVLHLFEDVMGWALVLVGAIVMKFYDVPRIDAILGILLALWIIVNAVRNMKQALRVFFQGVPADLDLGEIEKKILAVPGIRSIHHTHLWSLDGEHHVFTGHLVLEVGTSEARQTEIKREVKTRLKGDHIFEATLEVECEGSECADPNHRSPHS